MWANCNYQHNPCGGDRRKSLVQVKSLHFLSGCIATNEDSERRCWRKNPMLFSWFCKPEFTNNEKMKSQCSKNNTEPLPHIAGPDPGDPQTTTKLFTGMWPELHIHRHNDHWKATKTPSSNQKSQGPMITPRPISDLNNPAPISEYSTCWNHPISEALQKEES
jgi:hypothetical protein